jgi:hypothetical protein
MLFKYLLCRNSVSPAKELFLAEPLKNQFGIEIPRKIAAMISGVTPNFPTEAFLNEVLITNTASQPQQLLIDLRIHFVKANGKTSPKVFKLKTAELAPSKTTQLGKAISLADMTTRKHYAGIHQVEMLLNGRRFPLGSFELMRTMPPNDAHVLNNVEI